MHAHHYFPHYYLYMHAGVKGVKVKVFGTAMDTKGREELTGMLACQSYQSCPICTHAWTPGAMIGRKQCVFDGFRRFLASSSRARDKKFRYKSNTYEYRCVETRQKPRYRDDEFVRAAVSLATKAQPFCGHRPQAPHLAKWSGFSWRRMNQPEPAHGNLLGLGLG